MNRRLPAFIALLFLLACALFIFSPLVADPDLWGHVRFGQDTLRTGQIIRADSYSYLTAGQRWINHEWLTEVFYGFVYNLAGAAGLIALNAILNLAIAGLIYWRLRRAAMGTSGALVSTLGACLVLRPGVLNVRPQVFTYLLLLLLLLLIVSMPLPHPTLVPLAHGRKGYWGAGFIAAAFLLIAVWANLHGGVLAGLGILYVWGLAYLADTVSSGRPAHIMARSPYRGVLLSLLLAPAALLLNPYGPDLVGFLLRTTTAARPEIVEWRPAQLTDPWGLYWVAALAVTVLAVGLSRRTRQLSLLAPLLVLALLPLSAVRHIPLFAVAAPVLAADHFADLWDRLLRRMPAAWRSSPRLARGTSLSLLTLAVLFVALAAPRLKAIVIQPDSANFPVAAVAVLKEAHVEGNMATEFNWGEYVIWHLGPGILVSVDGRRETVYSEAVYRENLDFMQGEGDWARLVDRPETELALVDRERPVYSLMHRKVGWTLAYEDSAAAVFVRSGTPSNSTIRAIEPPDWPANGAGMAFPVE